MKAYLKEVSEDDYEAELDDIYGDVEICGMIFSSGRALRELDPIAFNCGISDKPDIWICGECNSEYETEDEAEERCKE